MLAAAWYFVVFAFALFGPPGAVDRVGLGFAHALRLPVSAQALNPINASEHIVWLVPMSHGHVGYGAATCWLAVIVLFFMGDILGTLARVTFWDAPRALWYRIPIVRRIALRRFSDHVDDLHGLGLTRFELREAFDRDAAKTVSGEVL